MKNIFKKTILIYFLTGIFVSSFASENFFAKGLALYENKKFDDAKFMFERSIVFNPKDSNSYLYLAKIYNVKEDQRKEEKNLDATILIDPMLMKIGLEKSNYSQVKDLSKTFSEVCKSLCSENKKILETLANLEPKNDS